MIFKNILFINNILFIAINFWVILIIITLYNLKKNQILYLRSITLCLNNMIR